MSIFPGRSFLPIGCFLLASILSGCVDGRLGKAISMNPFARGGPEEKQYGPTPAQRMSELRDLGSRAKRLSPAEQEQQAADLSRRLQNEADPLLRARIVETLGAFKARSAVDGLRLALTDGDRHVRIAAVKAWERRATRESVNVLAETLASDTDVDVRLAATRALGSFQDRSAVRALGVALDDSDPALQYRAIESLRAASGRDYGNDLQSWRQFAAGGNPPLPEKPSIARRLQNWF